MSGKHATSSYFTKAIHEDRRFELWIAVSMLAGTAGRPLTLPRARSLAASARSHGGDIGPISLAGYNFHSELEIGEGIRVLVVSAQRFSFSTSEGESFYSSAPMNSAGEVPHISERFGLIRYDDAFGEVILRHVMMDRSTALRTESFRFLQGTFRRIP